MPYSVMSPEDTQKLIEEHQQLIEQLNQQIEQTNNEISGHKLNSVLITECSSNDIFNGNSAYSSMSFENSAEPQLDSDLNM